MINKHVTTYGSSHNGIIQYVNNFIKIYTSRYFSNKRFLHLHLSINLVLTFRSKIIVYKGCRGNSNSASSVD